MGELGLQAEVVQDASGDEQVGDVVIGAEGCLERCDGRVGRLELGAIRNVEYDLRFETFNRPGRDQVPSVKDERNATEQIGKGKKKKRR